jgi:hypothetical protein
VPSKFEWTQTVHRELPQYERIRRNKTEHINLNDLNDLDYGELPSRLWTRARMARLRRAQHIHLSTNRLSPTLRIVAGYSASHTGSAEGDWLCKANVSLSLSEGHSIMVTLLSIGDSSGLSLEPPAAFSNEE